MANRSQHNQNGLWHYLATRPNLIQPKLSVSHANDPQEQEADRVADAVMQTAESFQREGLSAGAKTKSKIQRRCNDCEEEDEKALNRKAEPVATNSMLAAPPLVHDVLKSAGQPLDQDTRAFMEPRFRDDFSQVRVHTDDRAADSASAVGARAYTVNRDIVFASGEYAPNTARGRQLLSHELAHVMQQGNPGGGVGSTGKLQRAPAPAAKKKSPPPVAGGNVLYIGMNNYKPEVSRLKSRFVATSVKVSTVTVTEEEAKTKADGATYDLTSKTGIEAFAGTLHLNGEFVDEVAKLLTKQSPEDRDDLAHVISVYNAIKKDGADRMSRVVLSGHSYGTKVYNEKVKGAVYFDALVKLADIFPEAAGQTKHLLVLACMAGSEDIVKDSYKKAFPNLKTFWGYTNSCPTGEGAADKLSEWADITDVDPTKLDVPPSGQANWAMGVYQSSMPIDATKLMTDLRGDESKFNEYFAGTKVDPDSHSGFLFGYYQHARTAAQHTSDITGADHNYAELHADQSFRLRFWPAMVSNFWKKNKDVISKGYGTATAPNYGSLSRKAALAEIAKFDSTSTATGKDKDEAGRLLKALKDLTPSEVSDNWLTP